MVPERQAFNPSQKAVKAVADSTVSRPRRSRAKYRDNRTPAVEARPSRPAQKRRLLSRMDSLSDSKASDGSDSCLEVPVGRGRKVSGSRGSEVPGTRKAQDPKSRGVGDVLTQGLQDTVSRRLDDPMTLVAQDPMSLGLVEPVSQGSVEPVTQGSADPVTLVVQDPVSQGSVDPVSQGPVDPVTQRSGDPMIPHSAVPSSQSLIVFAPESKQMGKGRDRVNNRPPKKQPKKKRPNVKPTPTKEPPFRSTNEAKHDIGSGERMLLRQWLEVEADGGRIPGLRWLDKNDGLVRINWRHGSRAEWSSNDVTVFKCWALHTGRLSIN